MSGPGAKTLNEEHGQEGGSDKGLGRGVRQRAWAPGWGQAAPVTPPHCLPETAGPQLCLSPSGLALQTEQQLGWVVGYGTIVGSPHCLRPAPRPPPLRAFVTPPARSPSGRRGRWAAEMSPALSGATQDHPTSPHGPWQATESKHTSLRRGLETQMPPSEATRKMGRGSGVRSMGAATALSHPELRVGHMVWASDFSRVTKSLVFMGNRPVFPKSGQWISTQSVAGIHPFSHTGVQMFTLVHRHT